MALIVNGSLQLYIYIYMLGVVSRFRLLPSLSSASPTAKDLGDSVAVFGLSAD